MIHKWIGALLIMAGCGGSGFSMAYRQMKRERTLEQLEQVLTHMECELKYRLTPLPDLCVMVSQCVDGTLKLVLKEFSRELERMALPDAYSCMQSTLNKTGVSDRDIRELLMETGRSLGRYDLEGQLKGIGHIKERCSIRLEEVRARKAEQIRCYRVLGLSAGMALVILMV